jgi:hypothetical protein
MLHVTVPVSEVTSDVDLLRAADGLFRCSLRSQPKFKYLLPLNDEIAERINPLSKPYPNAPQAKRTLRLESIQERAV